MGENNSPFIIHNSIDMYPLPGMRRINSSIIAGGDGARPVSTSLRGTKQPIHIIVATMSLTIDNWQTLEES
jgi:hypothetical protein